MGNTYVTPPHIGIFHKHTTLHANARPNLLPRPDTTLLALPPRMTITRWWALSQNDRYPHNTKRNTWHYGSCNALHTQMNLSTEEYPPNINLR